MGKRDVYAHLMDLQAAVERQKTQITELANHASEERGARLIAEARLDAVAKCTRYSLSNDTPTGVDFDPEGDLLSVEEVWAALEQKDG